MPGIQEILQTLLGAGANQTPQLSGGGYGNTNVVTGTPAVAPVKPAGLGGGGPGYTLPPLDVAVAPPTGPGFPLNPQQPNPEMLAMGDRPVAAGAGLPPIQTSSRASKGGIGDYIGDVAGGITAVPKGSSPISAFAYGLAGAVQMKRGRKERDAAIALAAEDRAYGRERDKKADIRAERADARAERADARAGRTSEFGNLKTAAEIEKMAKDKGLPATIVLGIETRKQAYGASLGIYPTQQNPYPSLNPGDEGYEDAVKKVEAYGDKLEKKIRKEGNLDGGDDPDAPDASGAGGEEDDGIDVPGGATPSGGDGSYGNPFKGFASVEDFQKRVPIDGYYIDDNQPGVILQRKK